MDTILDIDQLQLNFPIGQGIWSKSQTHLQAIDKVSLSIKPGETLGLVGESGCGKSSIGKCITRIHEPTGGSIKLMGRDITHLSERQLRPLRSQVQMVFQDPANSLNPRMDISELIGEPLHIHHIGSRLERNARIRELLNMVGLPASATTRFPHEFSGGQRQRIALAIAIALKPKLLILDEPISALDVSIQSQILNLLLELQRELGLSYLFISHNLSVVRHIADRIAVMYLGKIVEMGDTQSICSKPRHAYTRALLNAIPRPDPSYTKRPISLPGEIPSPINPPRGSAFGHRINHPYREVTYGMDMTPREVEPGHWIAPDPCAISLSDLRKLGIDIYQ